MKIAMVHTPFWRRAGGERQILRLAIEMQKRGHEVEIFTNAVNWESYPEFFNQVKLNVVPHPLSGKLPRGVTPQVAVQNVQEKNQGLDANAPGLRKWMSKIVGRQFYTSEVPAMFTLGRKIPSDFDIINNHNFPTEWAAFLAKKRLKAPVVWMCNEPPYWFFSPENRSGLRKVNWPLFEIVDKTCANYIDEIMVLSRVSQEYVRKAYHKPSRIVRTGVDVKFFHDASGKALRAKLGLEKAFVVLFVGGSRYAKRHDLIEAVALLAAKNPDIKLLIDTSREREELTKLSEQRGIKDKVLFLHSTNDAELAEVYAACDCFVYPSSASPWGLVVTEAMAAGKPVIVSREVGVSEIIESGVNGIVIDKASPQAIAEQVQQLMDDSMMRQRIGENAYRYVEENLSWEKYAERVENIFLQTLSAKKNRK